MKVTPLTQLGVLGNHELYGKDHSILGVSAAGASTWTAEASAPTRRTGDHAVVIVQFGPAVAADPFLAQVLVYCLPEAKIIVSLVTELAGYHVVEYGRDDNKLVKTRLNH